MSKCYKSYLATTVKGVLSLIRSTAYIATGVNLFLNRTFIHKINPTNMLAISDVSISQSKMRKVYIYKRVYHFYRSFLLFSSVFSSKMRFNSLISSEDNFSSFKKLTSNGLNAAPQKRFSKDFVSTCK